MYHFPHVAAGGHHFLFQEEESYRVFALSFTLLYLRYKRGQDLQFLLEQYFFIGSKNLHPVVSSWQQISCSVRYASI